MTTLNKRIALCYKIPRVSSIIEEDMKQIKRINILLGKLEKTTKDIYIHEMLNILRSLNNLFNFNDLFFVLCEVVDFKYHESLAFIIEKMFTMNDEDILVLNQKLKDLPKDE